MHSKPQNGQLGYMGPIEPGDSHDCNSIIVKDRWNIFRRKFIGGIAYEEAGLPNSTVTDHDTSVVEVNLLAIVSLKLNYIEPYWQSLFRCCG